MSFELLPLTGYFGAEVRGVDLAADLDEADALALKRAFVAHKVLVFRDQHSLTPEGHIRFAERFGPAYIHPFHPRVEGHPKVDLLKSQGKRPTEGWHHDLGFEPTPNLATVLRAVDIPPYGRDTVFADSDAAYEGLSPVMQRMLEGLEADYDWRPVFGKSGSYGAQTSENKQVAAEASKPAVHHPVVAVNPDTGRKALLVNPVFTTKIIGMRADESAALLRFLFDQMHFSEYQLRVQWQPGTVAMWDNRSTQHRMIFDHDYPRVMHRVVTTGTHILPERAADGQGPQTRAA